MFFFFISVFVPTGLSRTYNNYSKCRSNIHTRLSQQQTVSGFSKISLNKLTPRLKCLKRLKHCLTIKILNVFPSSPLVYLTYAWTMDIHAFFRMLRIKSTSFNLTMFECSIKLNYSLQSFGPKIKDCPITKIKPKPVYNIFGSKAIDFPIPTNSRQHISIKNKFNKKKIMIIIIITHNGIQIKIK